MLLVELVPPTAAHADGWENSKMHGDDGLKIKNRAILNEPHNTVKQR